MPQRNLLLLIVTTIASYVCYVQGGQNPYRRYLADGLAKIQSDSLDDVPGPDLFAGAMEGMVEVLRQHGDQHSQFFNEAEADRLRNEIHQQIGGIGVRIGIKGDPPQPHILPPIEPDTPAGRAKLLAGDRIVQIDDKPTVGMNRHEVLAMLNGERGTTLRLVVQRPSDSQPRSVELVRELIPVESALGDRRGPDGHWVYALEDDPRIALVRLVTFGDRTASELANVLQKLTGQDVQGVVLDLRDNAGGALGSAVAVCEMLLPAEKAIVETRARDQTLQRYVTKTDGPYRDLPVAVILNQNSASASEIVAAALQDHGRGVVVGQRSFGKGTVQQMVPLGKSLLKLTWAGFRRPSGANIHRAAGAGENAVWGVRPDAGYECNLSPSEHAVYREFRSRRDERDWDAAESEPPIGGAGSNVPATEFVDEPLQLAKRYVQEKLGGKLESRP